MIMSTRIYTRDLIRAADSGAYDVVRVDLRTITEEGNYQARRAELPVNRGTLSILAMGLLAGRPFTERVWAGRGNPLSCGQVRTLRVMFQKLGVLEPVNAFEPRQGYRLTRAGRAFMKYYANSPTLPHL
jgi:hypothetical protein